MPTATRPRPAPPDPRPATTVADLVGHLRATKVWAGDPSIRELARRIDADRAAGSGPPVVTSTVGYCFDARRRRLDYDLVFELLHALGVTGEPLGWWRQAWQAVFTRGERAVAAVSTDPPRDVPWFRGRSAELDELVRAIAGSAPVSVVEGMAGVGKTALAIRAARRSARADRLELYVNLRGFDPILPAADPAGVLDGFLRQLGVAGGRIPRGLHARAQKYRALLRRRPALVLLDDAASAEQVRPLLPDGPHNRVVVTTRRTLDGLAGAHRLPLGALPAADALSLVRALVGDERVDAEPAATAEIAALSGRVPLALTLIGRHIRATPDWSLADHVERLRALGLADGVQAGLTLSYRQLDDDCRRMLRLVGVDPGPDLTAEAAAALADVEPAAARRRLDVLVAEHLLRTGATGRYDAHDLVRAYAARLARDEEPASRRRQAVTRLLDHHLGAAADAMDVAYPAERHRRPRVDGASRRSAPPADAAAARAWLDAERPTLLAAIAHAAGHGLPRHAEQLAATIWRHLDVTGRYGDIDVLHRHALDAARLLGDRLAEGRVWHNLGTVRWRTGRNAEALVHFERALALRRRAGDRQAQAQTLNNIAVVCEALGHHDAAVSRYEETLAIFREADDRLGEAGALSNLGVLWERRGRLVESSRHQRRALMLFRQVGSRMGEANALANLCVVRRLQGRPDAAGVLQARALVIFRDIGDRSGEAGGLINLADIHQELGQHDRALELCERALTMARDLGEPGLEAEALNSYGTALRAAGRLHAARSSHTRALALARQADDRVQTRRALDALADAADADGQAALAARFRRRAGTARAR